MSALSQIALGYATLKTITSQSGLVIYYVAKGANPDGSNAYTLLAGKDSIVFSAPISVQADATDFETNYKGTARSATSEGDALGQMAIDQAIPLSALGSQAASASASVVQAVDQATFMDRANRQANEQIAVEQRDATSTLDATVRRSSARGATLFDARRGAGRGMAR